jgi:phage baseplate assembly protein W
MTDYGLDMRCEDDLDPLLRDVSGNRLMAEVILHRLTTDRGRVLRHPDYGTNLRNLINDTVDSTRTANQIKNAIQSELAKEERIYTVDVTTSFVASTSAYTIQINGFGATGPFALTLGVSKVTVALITANPG